MPEYGSAAVSAGSGVTPVGDSLAGDLRATCWGYTVTSCPTPVLPATLSVTAVLGPAGGCVW